MLIGIVAELEHVPNALSAAGLTDFTNVFKGIFATNLTIIP